MKKTISLSISSAVLALMAFSLPAEASKEDSRIESSAQKSYVFKTYLNQDDIKVQSKNGAVILMGQVSEESHKAMAQETVADLPGVKSVDNRLEIKGDAPSPNSDAWLVTKVKSTLLFHRSVSASTTEVDVKDGIVTLRGVVHSSAQKDLTAEYARDVEGVKGVNNEMTVKRDFKGKRSHGEKIDDSSITAQVKMSLLYHRSTSALNTKVTTKRGVVTLSGKVNNASESQLAEKYTKDVNGVKEVRNRLTIE